MTQLFDETADLLPVSEFAENYRITLGELFAWLQESWLESRVRYPAG